MTRKRRVGATVQPSNAAFTTQHYILQCSTAYSKESEQDDVYLSGTR